VTNAPQSSKPAQTKKQGSKSSQAKKKLDATIVAAAISAVALVIGAVVTGAFGILGPLLVKPTPTIPVPAPIPTTPTTTSTPSPPAPKEQSINAVTDVDTDAQEAPPPQHGPLRVLARHIVANTCAGAPGWRVPLTPNRLGSAPYDIFGYGMPKWAKRHKGVEVSGTRIELTLKGATKDAIVIESIQASLISKVKPATGTHVVPYGECGGTDDSHYLVAKLDDTPPQVYEGTVDYVDHIEVVRKKSDRSFSARTFHVSRSDPEKFIVVAYASKFDYVWQLTIRWQDTDGKEYITTVNNEHGQPFSTAVQSSKTAYVSVPIGDGKASWQKITRHYGG
jgi:hypothetical protein